MGVMKQLYILVLAAVIIVGFITYFTQLHLSIRNVERAVATTASEVYEEVYRTIYSYPAARWLLTYWYEHASEMDIEYDVDFTTGTKTKEKNSLLIRHQPEFLPEYATEEEVMLLPEEDQKLYAEIVYSWFTYEINRIKRSYRTDFLFVLVTNPDDGENSFTRQFFLLSAADPGAERGTEYLEVYPLGHEVSVADNKEQQEVMREAAVRGVPESVFDIPGDTTINPEETGRLARAGDYADYYGYLGMMEDDSIALVGLTYDISGILRSIRSQTLTGSLYAVLYQFILLQLIMLHVFFYGISPMKKILHSIRRYTKTKDSKEVTESLTEVQNGRGGFAIRRNEIGELSEDTIYLAAEMDDYAGRIEKITAERERIDAELSLASQIQNAMLPDTASPNAVHREFELQAEMDPAREVGGDFYDVFMLDPDHIAILVADVSGKGVPAALFMMASQIVIHNMATLYDSPSKILEMANNEICEHNIGEMFVTVWLGILEISTGTLKAASGGHEYPAFRRPEGSFELIKEKHGFVLGGMHDMKYSEFEIKMEPGSQLFLYTDGVPEAMNASGQLFGFARMLDALNEDPDAGPEEHLRNVRRTIDAFVGDAEQFDDLTMLCLRYNGPDAP